MLSHRVSCECVKNWVILRQRMIIVKLWLVPRTISSSFTHRSLRSGNSGHQSDLGQAHVLNISRLFVIHKCERVARWRHSKHWNISIEPSQRRLTGRWQYSPCVVDAIGHYKATRHHSNRRGCPGLLFHQAPGCSVTEPKIVLVSEVWLPKRTWFNNNIRNLMEYATLEVLNTLCLFYARGHMRKLSKS